MPICQRLLALAALSLLLAACRPGAGELSGAPATAAASGQPATVPPLSLATIDGRSVSVPDGSNPTLVYFFAPICPSCSAATRELDALQREYADSGLRVLAIDLDPGDTDSALASFRDSSVRRSAMLWAIDAGRLATRAYNVISLEATILVGARGEVLFRSESAPNVAALRGAIQAALSR